MKKYNNNLTNKITKLAFLFSVFLCFSCKNVLQNQDNFQSIPKGKAYLVINAGDITARTIKPDSDESLLTQFTSFTLSGTGKDAGNKSLSLTVSATDIKDLYNKQILLDAGTWTFTLKAFLGNSTFTATTSDVLIEEGKANSVSFNLQTNDTKGGLSVKINFDKTNVSKVNTTLTKLDDDNDDSNDEVIDSKSQTSFGYNYPSTGLPSGYITYERLSNSLMLEAGEYRLVFEFYWNDTEKLNTFQYIVHIAEGVRTSFVKTVDLNEVFKITYNGIKDSPYPVIADSYTIVEKYTRKSQDIILPRYNRQDRLFKGWYDEDGNIITKISHNANRNYTLTCQWELLKSGDPVTIYVNPEAEAHYGFSEEYGLESLEAAMETIEKANAGSQNHDWIIKIKGKVSGSHIITTDVSRVKQYVKSITLEGATQAVAGQTEPQDFLKGGITTATENGAVLSVQIPVPVIIKNLKITGGNNSNTGDIKGGGIYIAEGSTVTLDDGALITGNSAATGAGIYVEGGEFTMNGGEISGNKTDASNNGEGNGAEKSYGAGGGVFVYADGSFTMSGGEISGNSAINKKLDEEPTSTMYAYGGGVCLQASGSKLASFTMTGGTISGNTAGTSGNGIGFFGSLDTGVTGTISLGRDAIITNNDIYLPSNVTITIIESMTGGLEPEIRATITPQEYKLDQPILNNVGVTPEYEYDYFAVTPQGTTTWTINTEGKLTKATSGGSSSGSSGNDFMTVTGGEFEYDFQAGEHVGTVENDNDYDAGTLTIPDLEVCSHLVTQYEYEQLMTYYGVAQSNDALIPNETSESAKKNTPAYFVSWIDAIVYCNLRSEAEGLTPVYKIAEENSITVENSPWTQYYNVAKDSNNKYYYNSDDYNDTSSYDPDASVFSYDLSADGYRLPTTAEYQNIMSKNPDLISGGYNEWCQNYHYDYTRCMYDASESVHKPVNNIPTITRENNLGFRVVRNADASSGSNP